MLGKSPKRGNAAGYVRVSQVGGRSGDSFLSPDLQRERITAWAAYRGYTITEWYIDLDVSGRSGVRRPEFERMMHDAADGCFQMVAVYRLTRFGRSVKDTAARYAELKALGVGLASVTEDIDSSTATGGLVQNMLFALAEFESERIGEEWASVHANRRARGIAHASRGVFGYEMEGAVPVRTNPREAAAIAQLYRLRLAGTSWAALSDWLAHEGFKSPRGEPRFSQKTIAWILNNPTYAGLVRHGDALVEGQHPAIVPRDLWEQVQALRPRQARLERYGTGLGSGLVVCDACEYHMARASARNHRVYRCTARKSSRRCPTPAQIAAQPLDAYLEAEVLRRLDPRRMPKRGSVQRKGWADRETALERRIAEAAAAIDRLSDERYLLGSLGVGEFERQLERLARRRDEARAELEAAAVAASTPVVLEWATDWPRLSVQGKQRVVRAVIREVRITAGRGTPKERSRIVWAF